MSPGLSVSVPRCQNFTNDGLTRSGTGCFIAVPHCAHMAAVGVKRLISGSAKLGQVIASLKSIALPCCLWRILMIMWCLSKLWSCAGRRGLVYGVWNSHTYVGNILGSLIAGAFLTAEWRYNWGLSFLVPGLVIIAMSLLVLLFLTPRQYLNTMILELSVLLLKWYFSHTCLKNYHSCLCTSRPCCTRKVHYLSPAHYVMSSVSFCVVKIICR